MLLNHQGEIVFVTDAILAISGYGRRELVGKRIFDFFQGKDLRVRYESIVAQPNLTLGAVFGMRTKSGLVIGVELTIRNLLHLPDLGGVVVAVRYPATSPNGPD